jgi:hypothetical protein
MAELTLWQRELCAAKIGSNEERKLLSCEILLVVLRIIIAAAARLREPFGTTYCIYETISEARVNFCQ